jgi:hypothetical protein
MKRRGGIIYINSCTDLFMRGGVETVAVDSLKVALSLCPDGVRPCRNSGKVPGEHTFRQKPHRTGSTNIRCRPAVRVTRAGADRSIVAGTNCARWSRDVSARR